MRFESPKMFIMLLLPEKREGVKKGLAASVVLPRQEYR